VRILGGERAVILTLVTALAAGGCSSRARSAPPAVPAPSTPAATAPVPAAAPAGPGTAAAPGSAARATPALASLHNELSAIFGRGSVSHAQLAVSITSLTTGETLFALNERRMMVPASNQKLLTVAAAARRLGWDYRYTTRIVATGPVKADGTLDGDLVVVGSGDPTINPRHPDRWAVLDAWAGQVAARGVKVIGGHLIGDDNAFAEPGLGSGWSWDDLVTGYGSPIGALQYNENQVELLVGPGMEAGAAGIISMSPLGSGLIVDNQVKTVAADQPTRVTTERMPGWSMLTVRGQVALGAKPRLVLAAVENPTVMFLNAFREALSRKGIFVGGSALDIDDVRTVPDPSKAETWVTDQSPPLSEIIDPLLKRSRNGYAETLLWTLSPAGDPANEVAGLKVLRETLTELGVDPALYASFDGSGLSRYDMLTAESLTRVLAAIWNDPLMLGPYRSALPVAGTAGSIENRLKGTPAAGRVWAKTGSMFNIETLSGYIVTADDEPLAFSFLANNFTVPSAEIDAMMDEALLKLAGFSRRQ
jgi:serine-type D-Ala-D-Ala carboxypeptidase/endopeptidase (penicillin-binding protein 4)